MNKEEFKKLEMGDIIRHKLDVKSVVVTGNFGDRVTAVRTVDVTNPSEWDVIKKAASDVRTLG